MNRWVIIATWAENAPTERMEALITEIRKLTTEDIHTSQAGIHLPDSVGFGNCTWDVTVTTNLPPLQIPAIVTLVKQYDDVIANIEEFPLQEIKRRIVPTEGPVIKRTLLVQIKPTATDEAKEAFARQVMQMPDYISSIRSWAFSKVDQTKAPSPWTHVWEQEYESIEGLLIDYMIHPYHITLVDTWFDAENPKAVAEPVLAHLFYESPQPVIQ